MRTEGEKFDRWLVMSAVFHAAVFALVVFSPVLFPTQGDASWGTNNAGDGGINVKIVGTVSGLSLPSPEVVTEGAAANESKGLYKSEEAPPPPPPEDAEPIPETKAPVKVTPPPKPPRPAPPSKASTPAEPEVPTNAVPFGQGGKPSLAYGQFSTGAGPAGIGFGDGTFGNRYGWYVDAITRRISQNWLQSLVDNRIRSAPRVYLSFDIERNGTISNMEIKQPSGIPSLDRSAQRAILASNPLPPLPPDYRGGAINVSFYFEYAR
jgi:periplasmic protein TonB